MPSWLFSRDNITWTGLLTLAWLYDQRLKCCQQYRNSVSFSPKVSIGINSGEMISGNIGSAKLRRLDYTVIGDVVNTAQRLQSAAGQGQIVINETAYNKVKESFNCSKVAEVSLKNKTKAETIYEVMD